MMEKIHMMKFKFVFIERGHYQVTLADLLWLHWANDANVKKAQFQLVNEKKLSWNLKMKQNTKRIFALIQRMLFTQSV